MAEILPSIKLLCVGAAKMIRPKAPTVHLLLVIPVRLEICTRHCGLPCLRKPFTGFIVGIIAGFIVGFFVRFLVSFFVGSIFGFIVSLFFGSLSLHFKPPHIVQSTVPRVHGSCTAMMPSI
jgi:hypothetical protein